MSAGGPLFIHLIGLAGTGKLTIARALQRHFDCLLFDNHLVNNVVFSLIEPDGRSPIAPEVWQKVMAIRSIALAALRDHGRPGRSVVFTNELLDGHPRHQQLFDEVRALAASLGARLLPVRLLIDGDELARRVASPERRAAFKDIDAEAARQRPAACTLLRPLGLASLDLEVTDLSADEAARRILAAAGLPA